MLGRQVTAAFHRPLQARLRVAAALQPQFDLCIRTFSYAPRLLESAGRPRKAVGEPSRPVKRAVKKTAKKPTISKEDAAAKKVAEKEKKRLAREREKKKKAAAAKKAKQLAMTPEQLERKKASLLRAETRELKKAALNPPFPNTRLNAYGVFLRETAKKNYASTSSTHGGIEGARSRLIQTTAANVAAWKDISASELEHYNHVVHTEREKTAAEFKRWVESHSPEEIKLANVARRALRRQLKPSASYSISTKWRDIVDERAPKRAMTPYIAFFTSRSTSGDFKNIGVPDAAKLIGQEWKALSADEKKKFENIAEQDRQRYSAEVKSYSSASPTSTA